LLRDNLQAVLGGTRFEVLALSLDRGGADEVEAFYRELNLRHLKVHVDPTAAVQRQLRALGPPTTLLIEAQGREVRRLLGPAEWNDPEMIAFLKTLIGIGGSLTAPPTGSSEAVTRLRLPQNVACQCRDRNAARAASGFGGLSIGFPMALSPSPLTHVSASPSAIPDGRISHIRF
jgi:hypothetical protein